MRGLRDLSLAARIYRLSGTVVLIFLLVIGWLFLQFRQTLYEEREQDVRNLVEASWHLLEFHAEQAASGTIAPEEARRSCLEILRSQRFGKNNYFWVSDMAPSMIMHPLFPELNGQSLAGYRDPEGRLLFQEMVDTVRSHGQGFVHYLWPKPGSSAPVKKISFVKGFPEWGWMIGAGYYVDDIDSYLIRIFSTIGAILVCIVAGALALVAFVARSISTPMSRAVEMIEALEKGELDHRLRLNQTDEVGRLAKAMDAFADGLQYEILTAFDRLARGDFSFQAQGLIREPLAQTNVRLNALVAELHETAARERKERARTEAMIEERKEVEERVRFLAFHDSLTGLANRVLLEDRLHRTLAHALPLNKAGGLFFLDLDRFKVINDSLGHHAGDLLLKSVAERLKSRLRTEDTICRQGGDEFILLLPNLKNADDAAHIAEKILKLFARPFEIEGREVFLSPSIGISLYPRDTTEMTTLIKNADAAMYLAKNRGRNNFQFFKPELTATVDERLSLESDLRQAIARDELRLHYQPQVDARSGEITGVEALLRWFHPRLGSISPARFIPIAEECGVIEEIGEWVLWTACRQNKEWQEEDFAPIRLAVNVSGRQFRQADFVSMLDCTLEETGLDPSFLELEVTENILMENVGQTTRTLAELKDRGISLAIDDFGTGYSSLSYLRQFPIDRLKIDRSFVAEVTSNSDAAAIAGAILGLAHSLNLEVTAEGVETTEQAHFLREGRCGGLQGFLFGRPAPPEEISRLLRKENRLAM